MSLSMAPVEPEPANRTTWSAFVPPTASRMIRRASSRKRVVWSPVPEDSVWVLRVERQDRLADEVLDERERAAGGRVVGVGDAAQPERARRPPRRRR